MSVIWDDGSGRNDGSGQIGRLGSRYLLAERIGGGRMGEVFLAAVADRPEEVVAVKLLRADLLDDEDVVSRFLQEARLLRSVDHPNVVRILDLVAEGGRLGIVMRHVPGGDLRRAVRLPCPGPAGLTLLAQIADGLAAIHATGIVHRDLKPENVLVQHLPDGSLRPQVSDFGLSYHGDMLSTWTGGLVLGTPGYLSPEAADGYRPGPAGDLYALGVMGYELWSGRRPFVFDSPMAVLRAHVDRPAPRPPEIPDRVWELLAALLAKSPGDRPDAADAARRFRALAEESRSGAAGRATNGRARLRGLSPPPAGRPRADRTVHAPPAPSPSGDLGGNGTVPEVARSAGRRAGSAGRVAGPGLAAVRSVPPPRRPARVLAGTAALTLLAVGAGVLTWGGLASEGKNAPRGLRPGAATAPSTVPAAPSISPPGDTGQAGSGGPSPSVTTRGVARAPDRVPLTPMVTIGVPATVSASDGQATLVINGIDTGLGITSISVLFDGGRLAVTPIVGDPGPYRVTVTGLVNGQRYVFRVRVCASGQRCTTSGPVPFTPFGLPSLGALTADRGVLLLTIAWPALELHGNPRDWSCRLTAVPEGSSDADAPNQTLVPAAGGSLTWLALPSVSYSAKEACTDGVTTIATPVLSIPGI